MQDRLILIKNTIMRVTGLTTVKIGLLPLDERSACIRLMPSGNGPRYYNGAREQTMLFQVLVKSPDQLEALTQCQAVTDELEQLGMETYTEPNFLQKEQQSYIYQASFQTMIHK